MNLGLITQQIERFQNARRLGVTFFRNRWFSMPESLRINGEIVHLALPSDSGVKNDFVACAIRNDYGLGREISNPTNILDIGANVGFFSLCARNFYPEARIHAYEPNPRIYSLLESNLKKCRAEAFQEAIGAATGFVEIIDLTDSNLATTRTTDRGSIRQNPLSSAVARMGGSVDLLKLDCEGAEWSMLEQRDGWESVKKVRMEYHLVHSHTLDELKSRLAQIGFKITLCRPETKTFGILWCER